MVTNFPVSLTTNGGSYTATYDNIAFTISNVIYHEDGMRSVSGQYGQFQAQVNYFWIHYSGGNSIAGNNLGVGTVYEYLEKYGAAAVLTGSAQFSDANYGNTYNLTPYFSGYAVPGSDIELLTLFNGGSGSYYTPYDADGNVHHFSVDVDFCNGSYTCLSMTVEFQVAFQYQTVNNSNFLPSLNLGTNVTNHTLYYNTAASLTTKISYFIYRSNYDIAYDNNGVVTSNHKQHMNTNIWSLDPHLVGTPARLCTSILANSTTDAGVEYIIQAGGNPGSGADLTETYTSPFIVTLQHIADDNIYHDTSSSEIITIAPGTIVEGIGGWSTRGGAWCNSAGTSILKGADSSNSLYFLPPSISTTYYVTQLTQVQTITSVDSNGVGTMSILTDSTYSTYGSFNYTSLETGNLGSLSTRASSTNYIQVIVPYTTPSRSNTSSFDSLQVESFSPYFKIGSNSCEGIHAESVAIYELSSKRCDSYTTITWTNSNQDSSIDILSNFENPNIKSGSLSPYSYISFGLNVPESDSNWVPVYVVRGNTRTLLDNTGIITKYTSVDGLEIVMGDITPGQTKTPIVVVRLWDSFDEFTEAEGNHLTVTSNVVNDSDFAISIPSAVPDPITVTQDSYYDLYFTATYLHNGDLTAIPINDLTVVLSNGMTGISAGSITSTGSGTGNYYVRINIGANASIPAYSTITIDHTSDSATRDIELVFPSISFSPVTSDIIYYGDSPKNCYVDINNYVSSWSYTTTGSDKILVTNYPDTNHEARFSYSRASDIDTGLDTETKFKTITATATAYSGVDSTPNSYVYAEFDITANPTYGAWDITETASTLHFNEAGSASANGASSLTTTITCTRSVNTSWNESSTGWTWSLRGGNSSDFTASRSGSDITVSCKGTNTTSSIFEDYIDLSISGSSSYVYIYQDHGGILLSFNPSGDITYDTTSFTAVITSTASSYSWLLEETTSTPISTFNSSGSGDSSVTITVPVNRSDYYQDTNDRTLSFKVTDTGSSLYDTDTKTQKGYTWIPTTLVDASYNGTSISLVTDSQVSGYLPGQSGGHAANTLSIGCEAAEIDFSIYTDYLYTAEVVSYDYTVCSWTNAIGSSYSTGTVTGNSNYNGNNLDNQTLHIAENTDINNSRTIVIHIYDNDSNHDWYSGKQVTLTITQAASTISIDVVPNSLSYNTIGSTEAIVVTTTLGGWSLSSSTPVPNYASLSASSGNTGNTPLSLTLTNNEDTDVVSGYTIAKARSFNLTFVHNTNPTDVYETISISQAAATYDINSSESSITFNSFGGDENTTITSDFTGYLISSITWNGNALTLSESNGTYEAYDNSTKVFTITNGKKLYSSQTKDPNTLQVSSTVTITLETENTSSQNTITGSIVFRTENAISSGSGYDYVYQTINLTQQVRTYSLTINPDSLSFSSGSSSDVFTVISGLGGWEITNISDNGSNWISFNKSSASLPSGEITVSDVVTVTVTTNYDTVNGRSSTITITNTESNPTLSKTLTISQSAAVASISASSSSLSFDAFSNLTKTVTITSDYGGWELYQNNTIIDGNTWITVVNPTSASLPLNETYVQTNVSLTADTNIDIDNGRTGTLIFRNTVDTSKTVTINVSQEKANIYLQIYNANTYSAQQFENIVNNPTPENINKNITENVNRNNGESISGARIYEYYVFCAPGITSGGYSFSKNENVEQVYRIVGSDTQIGTGSSAKFYDKIRIELNANYTTDQKTSTVTIRSNIGNQKIVITFNQEGSVYSAENNFEFYGTLGEYDPVNRTYEIPVEGSTYTVYVRSKLEYDTLKINNIEFDTSTALNNPSLQKGEEYDYTVTYPNQIVKDVTAKQVLVVINKYGIKQNVEHLGDNNDKKYFKLKVTCSTASIPNSSYSLYLGNAATAEHEEMIASTQRSINVSTTASNPRTWALGILEGEGHTITNDDETISYEIPSGKIIDDVNEIRVYSKDDGSSTTLITDYDPAHPYETGTSDSLKENYGIIKDGTSYEAIDERFKIVTENNN